MHDAEREHRPAHEGERPGRDLGAAEQQRRDRGRPPCPAAARRRRAGVRGACAEHDPPRKKDVCGFVAVRMRLRPALLLAVLAAALCPAAASAADVPAGADLDPGHDPVLRRREAARRHPAPEGPADRREDAGDPLDRPVLQPLRPDRRRRARSRARRYDPVGPSTGPSDRFLDFVEGAQADGARLHVRDGRPARLRRLDRLPGLGRAGRAGRRRQRGAVGRAQPWSTGKVGMYGKSYDGVTGLIGVDKQPAGPRGGRLAGAGLRPLPLPVRRRHPARELVPHPRALRRDRRHARPDRRRPDLQPQRRQRHPAPRLPGRQLRRPGRQRRPRLGVLEEREPDPGRRRARTCRCSSPRA